MSHRRKVLSFLACLVAAGALSACGSSGTHTAVKDENNTGAGGVNSSYITLDHLQYQVQISRALNPYDVEDQGYLAGIPRAQRQPPPGQTWFAVFLLVQNNGHSAQISASSIALSDTQGHVYHPLVLPSSNVYAYRAATIAPGAQIPAQDSIAAAGPTQAALLLFQVPITAYDDRPLLLTITNPADQAQTGVVTLDV